MAAETNDGVRITTAKVYELLTQTHDEVQALRGAVNIRLAVMDVELTRLAKAEDLHAHENLYAHRGLVRGMKWVVGVVLTFAGVAFALIATVAK